MDNCSLLVHLKTLYFIQTRSKIEYKRSDFMKNNLNIQNLNNLNWRHFSCNWSLMQSSKKKDIQVKHKTAVKK
jgi:hypothetical protein